MRSGAGSAETAEKELWNGATLVGPHRDDIAFELDGRDLAGFASRGQQRTAILALKLAAARPPRRDSTADPPLLLLDDVFSELDPDAAGAPRAPHREPAAGVRDHDDDATTSTRRSSPRRPSGSRRRAARDARRQPGDRSGDAHEPAAGRCAASATSCPALAAELGHRRTSSAPRAPSRPGERARRGARAGGRRRLAAARVQPPALVVSADDAADRPGAAAPRRRRCCDAFAPRAGGQRLLELRVVVRPPTELGASRPTAQPDRR